MAFYNFLFIQVDYYFGELPHNFPFKMSFFNC